MIPKIIHYCWFGGKPLPQNVEMCIKSWREKCPDYEIILWNENNYDINCNTFVQNAYQNKAWAFVSDYARLQIVYENGGIYLDTDVELLKSLNSLLDLNLFLGRQQSGEINTGIGFGAAKENAIIKRMLDEYDNVEFDKKRMLDLSCPFMNTKAIDKVISNGEFDENSCRILPPEYMDPLASAQSAKNLLCNDTISIHHYDASWTSNKQKFKRKIARIIGQDRIILIKQILRK